MPTAQYVPTKEMLKVDV